MEIYARAFIYYIYMYWRGHSDKPLIWLSCSGNGFGPRWKCIRVVVGAIKHRYRVWGCCWTWDNNRCRRYSRGSIRPTMSSLFTAGVGWSCVVFVNGCGVPVIDGVCRNSDPTDCINASPVGQEDVGVCILNSLNPLEVLPRWSFSLHRWSMRIVLYDGVSLWNHSCRYAQIQQALLATLHPRKGRRKYDSVCVHCEPTQCRWNPHWEKHQLGP